MWCGNVNLFNLGVRVRKGDFSCLLGIWIEFISKIIWKIF